MEIRNVFTEKVPDGRLIGKRYVGMGNFAPKWGEFFQNGWFDALEAAGGRNEFDYVGMMRTVGGTYEYWIGMMFNPGADAPEGFDYADVDGFEAAVFWIYGDEKSGELYSQCGTCMRVMKERGWQWDDEGWHIERYNCPRFTTPDEQGNVILDYYIQMKAS